MKKLSVYIVECRDGSYYTGVTNNIHKRVAEHNGGIDKKSYTFSRRPVNLLFAYEFDEPLMAIQFEKRIKGWSKKKKEALMKNQWHELKKLSVCQNESYFKYK